MIDTTAADSELSLGLHDMNAATREDLFSCSFVVVIVSVLPWRYVWRRYVRTPGDAWR
jgi:hypothetical protein